jgi:hypothetical protein
MSTLAESAVQVFQRLEEDPAAPVFWTQYEVYNALVEAMNEAALLTGVVQVAQSAPLVLPINTNYVAMPAGAVAMLRITGPSAVQKTEIFTLDQMMPGWELAGGADADPPIQQIQYWFPVGLDMFGIYPQLTAEQKVLITYLAYPVAESPSAYTGNETVPFQQEFQDGLESYAAHILRLKESGQEFQASQIVYQEFLDTMRALNVFQARHDSLVFTRAVGAPVRVVPVAVR